MSTTTTGAIAQAMAAIHAKHLQAARPAETVKGSMRCTRCRGTLTYSVSATGVIDGRCNSINCLKWRN